MGQSFAISCPLPISKHKSIVMGHGSGGRLTAQLVRDLFLPAFDNPLLRKLDDQAVLEVGGSRVAFTTDSFVVTPLFFPGGNIGELAVNGTVNDLAMAGATPLYLSTAFILQEGTPLAEIGRIASAMGAAAGAAGVRLVTGDTKVVDNGSGDGVFVNTAGVGVVADGVDIGPHRAAPGDAVLISGDIGVHGVAVLSVRKGLEFHTTVTSDTAPLHGLVAAMLATGADVHTLRDPTRGGVAASLNEIARTAKVGIELDEPSLPIPAPVADACSLLGLDPLQVANEGKVLAMVPAAGAEAVLAAMRAHPYGGGARVIGRCVEEHPGMVTARTALGGTRIVNMPIGEQLPRIC